MIGVPYLDLSNNREVIYPNAVKSVARFKQPHRPIILSELSLNTMWKTQTSALWGNSRRCLGLGSGTIFEVKQVAFSRPCLAACDASIFVRTTYIHKNARQNLILLEQPYEVDLFDVIPDLGIGSKTDECWLHKAIWKFDGYSNVYYLRSLWTSRWLRVRRKSVL